MQITAQELLPGKSLPQVVQPQRSSEHSAASLGELITIHRSWMDDALSRYGGILFRGFAIHEIDEFQSIAQAAVPELKPYVEGQSPRTKVADKIYTSTEFPAAYRITLHNELSYARQPPSRILFCCKVAPTDRGETPIVDCRRIYQLLEPEVRDRLQRHGIRYVKNMHGSTRGMGKSWMDHFETTDRRVVEAYLQENDVEFEWTSAGTLRTWSVRPAFGQHPSTGEWYWFNQANLWHVSNLDERHRRAMLDRCAIEDLPTHAFYGDGSPIDDEVLDRIRKLLWEEAVFFPWIQGDVLLLDNHLVAHGRNAYSGPRQILVAMG